jgi:hypothetical protein
MTTRKDEAARVPDRASSMEMQRIRVNKHGYDADGAYWGSGPDVFIATLRDGAQEVTVRASSIAQARDKVIAELARAPEVTLPEQRDALGGTSPNKSRYEIDWRDPVAGAVVRVRITHSRDYLGMGQDHIEVESIMPKKSALPITETGYRSHFLTPLELINAGGPVTFVTAWLDAQAKGKDWQKRQTSRQQEDLFSWAAAQGNVVKPKRAARSERPGTSTAKMRRRDHDPA